MMYCHYCSGKLTERKISDAFFKGWLCENGHKLSARTEKYSQDEYWEAKNVQVKGNEKAEILKGWLENPIFRKKLPDQLCELLRAELEQIQGEELNKVISGYKYCPICADELQKEDSPDVWVAKGKCSKGHTWWMRHEIWSDDKLISQQLDITTEAYLKLKKFYKESTEHRKRMPNQIWEII